ncbi:putative mechanosensitive channel protein [Rhodovulum sulfidophilum]|uniref:Putative mechanosensitive channel protein n=1 Tax=Rhodovulum sulfidophilum TaxID=35806 RepID=A0A0D6AZY5_RHOSU|nr:putative mechanosensitive channel protein [Rhodovulum sulfidophilum]
MNMKFRARRLVWPSVFSILSIGLILLSSHIAVLVGTDDALSTSITALAYFSFAWLASRVVSVALDAASPRNRPYPRLLRDLIAAFLFLWHLEPPSLCFSVRVLSGHWPDPA